MSDEMIQDSQAKIEEMEARIAELEAQLAGCAEKEESHICEEACEVSKDFKARAERFYRDLAPFVEKYREGREEIVKKVSCKVCEHPAAAMAVAFGAGLVIAKLLEIKIERCGCLRRDD